MKHPRARSELIGYHRRDLLYMLTSGIAFPSDTPTETNALGLTEMGAEDFVGLLRLEMVNRRGKDVQQTIVVLESHAVGVISQLSVLLEVAGRDVNEVIELSKQELRQTRARREN